MIKESDSRSEFLTDATTPLQTLFSVSATSTTIRPCLKKKFDKSMDYLKTPLSYFRSPKSKPSIWTQTTKFSRKFLPLNYPSINPTSRLLSQNSLKANKYSSISHIKKSPRNCLFWGSWQKFAYSIFLILMILMPIYSKAEWSNQNMPTYSSSGSANRFSNYSPQKSRDILVSVVKNISESTPNGEVLLNFKAEAYNLT